MSLFKKDPPAGGGLPVYRAEISASLDSDLEVNFIGLVDKPAIERNFQAFRKQQKRAKFQIDQEKQIISGPAMVAGMPLYRNDAQLGEYYVVFDKPTIQTIVQKFAAKGFMQKFNLFHDDQQQVSDVTIFNSFVTDEDLGIPPPAGFEDIPDGSWFISAKVNNPEVWEKVKNGTIKGFSVEGLFQYIPITNQKMSKQPAPAHSAELEWIKTNLKAFMLRDEARVKAYMAATDPLIEKSGQFSVGTFAAITSSFDRCHRLAAQQSERVERIGRTIPGLFEVIELLIDEGMQGVGARPSRRHAGTKREADTEEKFAAMARGLKDLRKEA